MDLLQSAIDQRKIFRSLTLHINKANATVDELKTSLDTVLKKIWTPALLRNTIQNFCQS